VEATLNYKLHKKEAVAEIEFKNTMRGFIRPQFYYDSLTDVKYLFLISEKVQPCIKRYQIILNKKLELLNSMALPESVVRGVCKHRELLTSSQRFIFNSD
jgi:hypothetical protein